MEGDSRPLHVFTDSAYVHGNFLRWAHWRHRGWNGDHADLWGRIHACLTQNPDRVLVSKVRAHLTWGHVAAGIISADAKIRNARADKLAGLGADAHAPLLSLEREARQRREKAKNRQKLMLDILRDRDLGISELPAHVTGVPRGAFVRRVRRRLA